MNNLLQEIELAINEIANKHGYLFRGLQGFEEPGSLRMRFSLSEHGSAERDAVEAFEHLRKIGRTSSCTDLQSYEINNRSTHRIVSLNKDNSARPITVEIAKDGSIVHLSLEELSTLQC